MTGVLIAKQRIKKSEISFFQLNFYQIIKIFATKEIFVPIYFLSIHYPLFSIISLSPYYLQTVLNNSSPALVHNSYTIIAFLLMWVFSSF
jgi:hypothetical protein